MLNLTLRQLHAILTVDRLGQINLAARDIGLTPPAVTLQIQQAEAMVGTALFERNPEGFRATDAGRAVINAARDIESRMATLKDDIIAIRGAGLGRLRLGAVSTAKYFVPRLMAGFAEERPGIEISLTIGNRAAIIEALSEQRIDIALMGRPSRNTPVEATLLGDHPLVIIAAPDHPLAHNHKISKRLIAEEHFFVRETGSGTRISLELFLSDIPGRLDSLGTEYSSNETIKQAVMAGMGVAFISAHTIAMEVEIGRLSVLDVIDTPVLRQWFTVRRADRLRSPAIDAFQNFVSNCGRDYLPAVPISG
jgi:LysR family transcriptional regulator, low CO2-responsive transcriptional regulator